VHATYGDTHIDRGQLNYLASTLLGQTLSLLMKGYGLLVQRCSCLTRGGRGGGNRQWAVHCPNFAERSLTREIAAQVLLQNVFLRTRARRCGRCGWHSSAHSQPSSLVPCGRLRGRRHRPEEFREASANQPNNLVMFESQLRRRSCSSILSLRFS
jgi:hypothetical protein